MSCIIVTCTTWCQFPYVLGQGGTFRQFQQCHRSLCLECTDERLPPLRIEPPSDRR